MPEDQRQDFSLYVDEFQNFATDSFATILSEARKYRLSLILANQFMTQLTDQIREAILGNIGTVISGRIGITDAEILVKKFSPTFDAEDLTRLPNFQTISSVMIQDVPSSAFSMSLLPPLGQSNPQLRDALKKLSATKFGKPRAQVEQEFFKRMGAGDAAKKAKMEALKQAQEQRMAAFRAGNVPQGAPSGLPGGMPTAAAPDAPQGTPVGPPQPPSFLDEWLAKRQQIVDKQKAAPDTQKSPFPSPAFGPTPAPAAPEQAPSPVEQPTTLPKEAPRPKSEKVNTSDQQLAVQKEPEAPAPTEPEKLHVRDQSANADDHGVSIKLR